MDTAPLFLEILIDAHGVNEHGSVLCGCLCCVLYKCGEHPSCHSDWCMGSLCVPLSYLSESSAVHCGACLLHRACGCPPSEAIGCERGGDLCLKGGEARPEEGGGGGGSGVSNQRLQWMVYNWDTTVTWLVTQSSISQTWDFVLCGMCWWWCAVNVCSANFQLLRKNAYQIQWSDGPTGHRQK